jgi:pimeloyl-ACP methyl ester carboxylesterase
MPLPAQAARGARSGPGGPLPAVVVLPGIMGSALAVADGGAVDTVWMDYLDLARGALCEKLALPDRHRVLAEQPLPRTYGRLLDFLAASHRVVPFAYDWRISLKDEAPRLAERILVELEQTERENQPLVIVAHSMGGLLARALVAYRPEVWQRICRHPDARVLMLGTPTRGSHSIAQVLAGQERMITVLAALDLCNTRQRILDTVARFPGLLELLPDARRVGAATRFAWTGASGASGYRFQLARDPAFAELVAERRVDAGAAGKTVSATMDALAAGRYLWRVAAIDAAGVAGHWGAPQSFVQKGLPVSAQPVADASPAAVAGQQAFRWSATEAGQSWEWQLARRADFQRVTRDGGAASPTLRLDDLQPGRYYLRLRSRDADGFVSPWGEPREFDVPWPTWVRFLLPVVLLIPTL